MGGGGGALWVWVGGCANVGVCLSVRSCMYMCMNAFDACSYECMSMSVAVYVFCADCHLFAPCLLRASSLLVRQWKTP